MICVYSTLLLPATLRISRYAFNTGNAPSTRVHTSPSRLVLDLLSSHAFDVKLVLSVFVPTCVIAKFSV